MKFISILTSLCVLTSTVHAAAIPDTVALSIRSTIDDITSPFANLLEKRKGGGGGGGGGGRGGGSSSSSSGSTSSGSTSSGSTSGGTKGSGSSGSTSGSTGSTGSTSTGGRTTSGSGVRPAYGSRGNAYAGGAVSPYSSGLRSPLGISPLFLAAPALYFGGLWAYGAYSYPYSHPYNFHNASSNNNTNTSLPVQCLCAQYQECGCDNNNDTSYLDQIVGNGTNLNQTVAKVADVNGTSTLLINGTLANGTTASGGTASASAAGSLRLQGLAEASGWWMMIAVVSAIVLTV